MKHIAKEAFQGHPWYSAIEEFLAKGRCEVVNELFLVG